MQTRTASPLSKVESGVRIRSLNGIGYQWDSCTVEIHVPWTFRPIEAKTSYRRFLPVGRVRVCGWIRTNIFPQEVLWNRSKVTRDHKPNVLGAGFEPATPYDGFERRLTRRRGR